MTSNIELRLSATLTIIAIVTYCILGGLQIAQVPGIQYDEAALVVGAVHIIHHSPTEPPMPHADKTWLCVAQHCFPLMAELNYIGAVKDYLALPVLAFLGPNLNAIRAISLLMGCLGIWGIMSFAGRLRGPWVAGATGFALAISPAYIDLTVFDNSAIAAMMAGLGLICATLGRYVGRGVHQVAGREALTAALCVGLAAGVAVWARANIVWTLAAMAFSALVVFRGRMLRPVSNWMAAAAGGAIGGLPFLIYQVRSRGGTWRAMDLFVDQSPLRDRLYTRLVLFAEALVSDREHRAMWGDVSMNSVERWMPLAVVLAACAVCLLMRGMGSFARFSSLTFLSLSAILFASRMEISEHHLIAVLPFAVLVVVLAGAFIHARHPRWSPLSLLAGLTYLIVCLRWDVLAVRGLRETGGIGMWSNAESELARRIEQEYPNRLIQFVDWGFQYGLYVSTDGRMKSQEIFWGATEQQSGRGLSWPDEIRAGGVFVVAGPENRQEPTAGAAFLKALSYANPLMRRETVLQRSGVAYAEIIDVSPNSARPASGETTRTVRGGGPPDRISMGDPTIGPWIGGFYQPEDGSRWTGRNFFVILRAPDSAGGRLWLQANVFLPESMIQALGPITLSARVGSHALAPKRFEKGGANTLLQELKEEWLGAGNNRIDFSLDKVQPPAGADRRELGIVVTDVLIKVR